jgi:hypothetical protein
MDSRICQTSTASPAEPGGLSFWTRPSKFLLRAQKTLRVITLAASGTAASGIADSPTTEEILPAQY